MIGTLTVTLRNGVFAPSVLVLSHLVAAVALRVLGWQGPGPALLENAQLSYLAFIFVTVVSVILLAVRSGRSYIPVDAILATLPAFASLVLLGSIWITGWYGGAPNAPNDIGDATAIAFFVIPSAIIFCCIAYGYGSMAYLTVMATFHMSLYFVTYAWPNWIRYPETGLLGPQPYLVTQAVWIYLLGTLATLLRRWLRPLTSSRVLYASSMATIFGALYLSMLLSTFPNDGGYFLDLAVGMQIYIPVTAWGWCRFASQFLALVGVLAALISPFTLLRWQRGVQPVSSSV